MFYAIISSEHRRPTLPEATKNAMNVSVAQVVVVDLIAALRSIYIIFKRQLSISFRLV